MEVKNQIKYWYMRYLMVTELFMVETWEQHLFHCMLLLFCLFTGIFNHIVLLKAVELVRNWCMSSHPDQYQPIN